MLFVVFFVGVVERRVGVNERPRRRVGERDRDDILELEKSKNNKHQVDAPTHDARRNFTL